MTEKEKGFFRIFVQVRKIFLPERVSCEQEGMAMETFDKDKARRVWQRVQSREGMAAPDPVSEGVPELLMQANTLAGLYMGLQRMNGGRAGEGTGSLSRSLRRTVDCLRGLCALEGTVPGLPPVETGTGSISQRLRSCAHRERRLGEGLIRLGTEGEFAPVYARLARESWDRCRMVLEMLGAPGK